MALEIFNTLTDVKLKEGDHEVSYPKSNHDVSLPPSADRILIVATQTFEQKYKLLDLSEVASITDNGIPVAVPGTMKDLYDIVKPFFFSLGGGEFIPPVNLDALIEPNDVIPQTLLPAGSDDNRSPSTTFYEGGTYRIFKYTNGINRFRFRTGGTTGANTIRFSLWQNPDGSGGVVTKIMEADVINPGSGTNFDVTVPAFDIVPGYLFIVWGIGVPGGGGFALRVYNQTSVNLINTTPGPTGILSTFRTNVLAGDPLPATLNFDVSGTDIVQQVSDSCPIIRLYKV